LFTGIVEELGALVATTRLADGDDGAARLTVRGPLVTEDARPGDSIAVDGVCLTVVETADGAFTADVMGETLRRTTLGTLTAGTPVNLERAAALGDRLGGHLVQGHVDGVAEVLERASTAHWDTLRVGLPPALARYVAEKGSVALAGVSLTVASVADGGPELTVGLVPETLARTTLGRVAAGAPLNVEVDVVAKYVERLLGQGAS
jgi:riboflavin synthase